MDCDSCRGGKVAPLVLKIHELPQSLVLTEKAIAFPSPCHPPTVRAILPIIVSRQVPPPWKLRQPSPSWGNHHFPSTAGVDNLPRKKTSLNEASPWENGVVL